MATPEELAIKKYNIKRMSTHGKRKKTDKIIIHRTAGYGFQETDTRMTEDGIGAHFTINADGSIHQVNDVNDYMSHAKGHNQGSIGIEIAGLNLGGTEWEAMTPAQEEALKRLTGSLVKSYQIPIENVISHSAAGKNKHKEAEVATAFVQDYLKTEEYKTADYTTTNSQINGFKDIPKRKETPISETEKAKLDPAYLDPNKIQQEVIDKEYSPAQKGFQKHFDEYDRLNETLREKTIKLQEATDPATGGIVADIKIAQDEYDDARYNVATKGNALTNIINDQRRVTAEKNKKKYTPESDKGKQAIETIAELDKLPAVSRKTPTKKEWLANRGKYSGWDMKSGLTPEVVEANRIKQEAYLQEQRKIITGGDVSTDPKVIEKIAIEREKRDEEVKIIKDKEKENEVIKKENDPEDKGKTIIEDIPKVPGIEDEVQGKKPLTEIEVAALNKQATDDFARFDEPIENIQPDVFDYEAGDWGVQLPIEALGQGALGLIGMGDAKTELPLREDKISNAILQYSNDLKKMADMGLKPEEEAKMKQEISESYQLGITNIVRASGGNRNLVMGSLAGLNKNVIDGISNIGLLDIQKKESAFDKYGKTLEYIDSFNRDKAKDNHAIKLGEATAKRQAGAELASNAFAQMLDDIQYQKENGPGSANHRLKQAYMYELTGVNSGIKDDGSGTIPGTPSYLRAQAFESKKIYAERKQKYDNEKNIQNSWLALPNQQKQEWSKKGGYLAFKGDHEYRRSQQPKNIEGDLSITPQNGGAPNTQLGPDDTAPDETPMQQVVNRTSQEPYSLDEIDYNEFNRK